jgi:hypothetical protein
MTKEEKKVFFASGELYSSFTRLKKLHPSDQREVEFHIHAIQNIILARPAYKKYLKTLKK